MKIGIDLGTTNSALAYIDEREGGRSRFSARPHLRDAATGGAGARGAAAHAALVPVPGGRRSRWASTRASRARWCPRGWCIRPNRGSRIRMSTAPPRSCPGIRRRRAACSRRWKFRRASSPNSARSGTRPRALPLAEQDIVLTVPASFDEEARELTVMAARDAGLEQLTLLEEPAAAFYSWIANNLAQSRKKLFDGQVVLVCDVGGGTSDFSLIRVSREGDLVNFTRTAVGKHLLLGGDNLDLTLAWLVETKLGAPLSIRQRSGLRRQCSAAKERLLNDPNLKSVEITVLGVGLGADRQVAEDRDPARRGAGTGARRLPAVHRARRGAQGREAQPVPRTGPALRFRPRHHAPPECVPGTDRAGARRHPVQRRLLHPGDSARARGGCGGAMVRHGVRRFWRTRDLDLAVARGAAYYSYVRSTGQRRAGARRPAADLLHRRWASRAKASSRPCAWCRAAPKRARRVEIDNDALQLVANRPVSFRLYSSLTRTEDKLGDVLEFAAGDPDLHMHAPLNAVIRFGKKAEERLIPVKLGARLTEIGTLETWCESKISDNRWRLQFELRKKAAAQPAERKAAAVVSEQALKASLELIEAVFSPSAKSPIAPEELARKAGADHGARARTPGRSRRSARWPTRFWPRPTGARRVPAYEMRWLNLCGFCLRPGFGYPGRRFPHRAGAARLLGRPAPTATRCSAKSTGGSSGAAWPAG